MFAVKMVLAVSVAPHTGLAKTAGREKIRVELRVVRRSRTARGIDIRLIFKEAHELQHVLSVALSELDVSVM